MSDSKSQKKIEPASPVNFRLRRRVTMPDRGLPSRTRQAPLEECDINHLMKKYRESGIPPQHQQLFQDVSDAVDYQEAHDLVLHAQEQFAVLPALVRDRFHNRPELFLKFASDPKNAREMVNLGLAQEKPRKEAPRALKNDPDKGSGTPEPASGSPKP